MSACIKDMYHPSGYVNIPKIDSRGCSFPFTFVIGGRGTGKTYGVLEHYLLNNYFFIFIRRKQIQVDVVGQQLLSPFYKVCLNHGWTYKSDKVAPNIYGVWLNEEESPRCLVGALSTFSNVRGIGADMADRIFYDEFIPETHDRPIKHEGSAFFNCYETINRNRELEGLPAIPALLASNSENLASPLLMEAGLVLPYANMKKKGLMHMEIPEKGCDLWLLDDSPVSKRKEEETAIAKLTKGTRFASMAFSNEFVDSDFSKVKSMNLAPFVLRIRVGELYIYTHKSEQTIYVSEHKKGTPRHEYESDENALIRFRNEFRWLWEAFIFGDVWFETEICQILLTNYLKK